MKTQLSHGLLGLLAIGTACGAPAEAPRTRAPVVILPVFGNGAINDLGWQVTVSSLRTVIADLEFSVGGEAHALARPGTFGRIGRLLLPSAHAHPGHLAGGELAGRLPGIFVIDWLADAGRVLGEAELILASYNGINFSLPAGGAGQLSVDGLPATAVLVGRAWKDARTIDFKATLAVEPGTRVIGVSLTVTVDAAFTGALGIGFALAEPTLGDSYFRRIDFAALDPDGDGQVEIRPGEPAHNVLRRHLAEHVHYLGASGALTTEKNPS